MGCCSSKKRQKAQRQKSKNKRKEPGWSFHRGALCRNKRVPNKATTSSSSSSTSSHKEKEVVLVEEVQNSSSPSSISLKNPLSFSRGTVMSISTFTESSPEVRLHQDGASHTASGEFFISLPCVKLGSQSLLSALTNTLRNSPVMTFAELLLAIGSSLRWSGSSLLPQLSGMTSENLLKARADFLKAPKFVSNVRALLIGVDSYAEVGFSRSNTVQDLRAFRNCLGSNGWPTNTKSMRVLTKDATFANCSPSYRNILKQLHWLVDGATADTALLFVFAGVYATVDNEAALLPSNFSSTRLIRESMLYKELVTSLPDGANMTAIFDISSGGAGIQLPFMIQLTHANQTKLDESIFEEGSVIFLDQSPGFTPRF